MCLFPQLIRNPKFKENKKNGGIIPAVSDTRTLWVPIGCQECIECMKQKQTQWTTRLLEDLKEYKNGKFITLTFSNEQIKHIIEGKDTDGKKITKPLTLEGYTLDNQIATIAVRRFLERWRKKFKRSVRHWLITELGHNGTENIHLHGIIWTNVNVETVKDIWKYGFIWPRKSHSIKDPWKGNYVNGQTINYIGKYITKRDLQHKTYKPIILCSKGIGRNYTNTYNFKLNKYDEEKTDETYKFQNGKKSALPIYYRNKIYNEEEREKLWIEKLNKQERWIMGEKIDISKGWDEYYKRLKYHQKNNNKLGYGNNKKDWEQIEYEKQVRKMKYEERMNNNNKKKNRT